MLTVIGHDMRTPFVDAKGILELMADNELTENEKKSLTADLQKSVDLSLETLDNILAWATQTYYADNSESKIKPEQIDLHQVVEKIKLFFNQAALKKNIVLKNNISPATGIVADLEQISFVIRNLTANAVKFSHSNQTIIFSATEAEDKLTFSVRDEGVGMSHDALKSLFDMNRRTTMRGTANEKGSGLGLVFSKELIANHHGKLWIESTLGKGTTVCFSLPKLN
jgi:signal transduction histidine kinase